MLPLCLLAAAGLFSPVEAAPSRSGFAKAMAASRSLGKSGQPQNDRSTKVIEPRAPLVNPGVNVTVSAQEIGHITTTMWRNTTALGWNRTDIEASRNITIGAAPKQANLTSISLEDCLAPSVLVSTTTLDVTIYVTRSSGPSTESDSATSTRAFTSAAALAGNRTATSDSDGSAGQRSTSYVRSTTTMSRPLADSTRARQTGSVASTAEPSSSTTQTLSTSQRDGSSSDSSRGPTAVLRVASSDDIEPETQSTLTLPPSIVTVSVQATLSPDAPVTRVIDAAMVPVSSSSLSAATTRSALPTRTVTGQAAGTGIPVRDQTYCGVNGRPAGTYFIAEFIEDRPGVPVTLEGCYQFCDSVLESTQGCQAYRYYPNRFGAPRCKLYGMPVPWIVRDLDARQPGRWYDLDCGSPVVAR